MKTYYDLLELPRGATPDEIKHAFRREIAKYHPDKVQHLGLEFQEIAASKAAALTQAYRTLNDPASRAEYDAELDAHAAAGAESVRAPEPAGTAPVQPPPRQHAERRRPAMDDPPPAPGSSVFARDRAGAQDLVRRATIARFRDAVQTELGSCEETVVPGVEVVCVPKPSFWAMRAPPCVLGRFVPQVDAAAVTETWSLAARMKRDPRREVCVFLLGPMVAPAGDLGAAIAALRRKSPAGAGKVVMIPVNTATWSAHVPTDAPPVVKSLLARLRSA